MGSLLPVLSFQRSRFAARKSLDSSVAQTINKQTLKCNFCTYATNRPFQKIKLKAKLVIILKMGLPGLFFVFSSFRNNFTEKSRLRRIRTVSLD